MGTLTTIDAETAEHVEQPLFCGLRELCAGRLPRNSSNGHDIFPGMRLLLVPALEAKPFRAVYEVRAGLGAVRRNGDGERAGNGSPSSARYACSGTSLTENSCERVGPFVVSDHVSTAGKRPACISLTETAQSARTDCSMSTHQRVPYRFPGAIAAPGYDARRS
jgi:hypothetical protein